VSVRKKPANRKIKKRKKRRGNRDVGVPVKPWMANIGRIWELTGGEKEGVFTTTEWQKGKCESIKSENRARSKPVG